MRVRSGRARANTASGRNTASGNGVPDGPGRTPLGVSYSLAARAVCLILVAACSAQTPRVSSDPETTDRRATVDGPDTPSGSPLDAFLEEGLGFPLADIGLAVERGRAEATERCMRNRGWDYDEPKPERFDPSSIARSTAAENARRALTAGPVPEPVGPTTATTRPGATSRSIPSSSRAWPCAVGTSYDTPANPIRAPPPEGTQAVSPAGTAGRRVQHARHAVVPHEGARQVAEHPAERPHRDREHRQQVRGGHDVAGPDRARRRPAARRRRARAGVPEARAARR